MNSQKTLEKCRKFMTFFDNKKPGPKNMSVQLSKEKSKKSMMSSSKVGIKSSLKSFKSSVNHSSSSHKSIKNSSPFKADLQNKKKYETIYNRQSRYEKIMKFQVKPKTAKKMDPRSSYLQSSRSSFASASSAGNKSIKKEESRLEKIMKLKVSKPSTQSTLKNYQPVKREKSFSNKENSDSNSILEMKRCKNVIRKENKQADKQDRLWKVFERERELRLKQKVQRQSHDYQREISLERKFDRIVEKELQKIQKQKEMEERKELGFSPYLFPAY